MSAEERECPLCYLLNRLRRLASAAREWRPRPWRLRASVAFPFVGRSLRTVFQADFFSSGSLCRTKYLTAADKKSAGAAIRLDASAQALSTKQEEGACASN